MRILVILALCLSLNHSASAAKDAKPAKDAQIKNTQPQLLLDTEPQEFNYQKIRAKSSRDLKTQDTEEGGTDSDKLYIKSHELQKSSKNEENKAGYTRTNKVPVLQNYVLPILLENRSKPLDNIADKADFHQKQVEKRK